MGDTALRSGIQSGAELEDWIRVSYSRILKCCRCSGLSPSEADDIAQEIWLWLLRERRLSPGVSMPWFAAVTRNFILRYRRRQYRRSVVEGCSLDECPEPRTCEVLADLEVGELLDRVSAALSEIERRMLALIRGGHSLPESARLLGIPQGSHAYYRGRLIACARRELGRRVAPKPQPARVLGRTSRKEHHGGETQGGAGRQELAPSGNATALDAHPQLVRP